LRCSSRELAPLRNSSVGYYWQGLTEDLKRPPDTLEDLKFVLRVIADIRDKSLDVELRYVDLQERYRTLLMYDIEVREKIISPITHEKWGGYTCIN